MPLIFIILAAIAAFIILVVYAARIGRTEWLKSEWTNAIVFLLSFVSLIISIVLLVNLAIYSDEYGSSPVLVTGGWFWLNMYWLRLGLLFMLCLISGLKLVRRAK